MPLSFLRLIHLFRIGPLDAEVIVEVGSLFTLSILERPVSGVAGNLQIILENNRSPGDVLHRYRHHVRNCLLRLP